VQVPDAPRAAQIRLHLYTSRLNCANCSQLLWTGYELDFEPCTLSSGMFKTGCVFTALESLFVIALMAVLRL
jgi:hypothetical protein